MAVRYTNTQVVKDINERSVAAGRNRTLSDEAIASLDPTGFHVEAFAMVHNNVEMRVELFLKLNGQREPGRAFLDMSFEDYKVGFVEHDA